MIKPAACRNCQGSGETVSGYPCPTCHGTGHENQVIGMICRACPRLSGIWPEPIAAWRNPDNTPRRNVFVLLDIADPGKPHMGLWKLVCVLDRPYISVGSRVGTHEQHKDGEGNLTRSGVMAQQVSVSGREERLNAYDPDVMQAGTGRAIRAVLQQNEDGLWPRFLRAEWNARRNARGDRLTLTARDICIEKATV